MIIVNILYFPNMIKSRNQFFKVLFLMIKSQTLILCFIPFLFSSTTATKPTNCNRSCPGGLFKRVPYPFGFSAGCEIRFNCSASDGAVLIGEFPVQKLSPDGILVNVPVKCGRAVETLRHLYGENYAPMSHNAILLENCTAAVQSCMIPQTMLQTHLDNIDCGGNDNSSVSCYSEMNKTRMFLDYDNVTKIGCRSLFSGVSSEMLGNSTAVSLDVQTVQLGWWLQGNCDFCHREAVCTKIMPPGGRGNGFRCQCPEGIIGDGYSASSGCWKEKVKKTNTSLIIGSAVAASAIGFFTIVFVFIKIRRRGRGQGSKLHQMEGSDDAGEMNYYNLTTIQNATNNFSPDNKLGEGGFGPVYWGKLDDGKEIAVKRLCKNSRQGLEEFKTEVKLIIKLQHKNLVRLLGCCIKGNEPLLVYEYMPNTSVDAFLFDPIKCKELNWPRRANIGIGIAKGLRYLHEDSRLKIIHRDMKASNVLLDHEMNPKISDFGTARIFGVNQIDANTNKIVGTYGYMAPEYAMEGLFSIKSDVYSFGVLLLEMISGKRNNGFYNQEHRQNLLSYAWGLWRDGKGEELIDQNLIDECPVNEALRWIQIGLLCVQEDPNDRPTMSSVVFMLESQSMSLAEPREPPLGFGRLLASDQPSTSGASIGALSSYSESTSASSLLR